MHPYIRNWILVHNDITQVKTVTKRFGTDLVSDYVNYISAEYVRNAASISTNCLKIVSEHFN